MSIVTDLKRITYRKTDRKYVEWIELARAFAVLCIVLCYSVEYVYHLNIDYVTSISRQSRIFCFLCFTLGRCGVPVFLMISGYLLLGHTYDEAQSRKFWINNWLRLLICYEIWNVIYNVYLWIVNQKKFSVSSLLQEELFLSQVDMSHLWYMPMIIGMYLLIPFVANGLNSIYYKLLCLPIGIFFLTAMVYPVADIIMRTMQVESFSMVLSDGFSGGINGLYLIFGFLIKKGMFKKCKGYWLCMTGGITFLLTIGLQLWAYQHNCAYNVWYNCGLLAVSTVCLFELFSRVRTVRCYGWIRRISYYSFAIYLIHNMLKGVLGPLIDQMDLLQPLKVIFLWTSSFILSFLCAVSINKVPGIGRRLLYTK